MGKLQLFIGTYMIAAMICTPLYAGNKDGKITGKVKNDSIRQLYLNEVVVVSARKETNSLEKLPGSASFLSSGQMNAMQIGNITDIASIVPGFFVPDYGSKYTSPVYIRGIGNRSTGQATAMYVDNIPLINKSSYDFDFPGITHIELLRGPQGTLYGRNAMGGIVNIFTSSPLDDQRSIINLSGGNYGLFQTSGITAFKLSDRLGISLDGHYKHSDGYFTNEFTGKKADALDAAGGRIRLDYLFTKRIKASLISNYDYSDQGAYPYNVYDKATGRKNPINYNDPGSYLRRMSYNGLNLEYRNDKIILASTTTFQYLRDDMQMDQDYSPEYIYNIRQKQKQHAYTQEFTVKSSTKGNYRWIYGVFGFANTLKTTVDVNFGPVGIAGMLQPMLSRFGYTVTAGEVPVPGYFNTPDHGVAVFHQSTYDNLFVKGLSVTAGIRLDYEKNKLDYVTSSTIAAQHNITGESTTLSAEMSGKQHNDYTELLPKVSVKYEFIPKRYVYASASKGYNPGGYNIQALSELVLQEPIKKLIPGYTPTHFDKEIIYNPEFSWNYEFGFKGEVIPGVLSAEASLFYIKIDDMQLTQFVTGGRKIANIGKATNKGLDVHLHASLAPGLNAGVNYGYTHAAFDDYHNGKTDYKGRYLPFAPQHTLSVYAGYVKNFSKGFIDQFSIHTQYNGAGRIYWTEGNDTSQDFYGMLNAKAGVKIGIFTMDIWAKNALNKKYNTFYFEMANPADPSLKNAFLQQGKPATFGGSISITI